MGDIVEELRVYVRSCREEGAYTDGILAHRAAAEIERLRARVAELEGVQCEECGCRPCLCREATPKSAS